MSQPEAKKRAEAAAAVRWAAAWPDVAKRAAGYPLLKGLRHFDVFEASKAVGRCNHGPRLVRHDGLFRLAWACHARDVDAAGQRVMLAESADGRRWSQPVECFAPLGPTLRAGKAGRVLRAAGWTVVGGTLYAVAEGWEQADAAGKGDPPTGAHRPLGWLVRAVAAEGRLGAPFWLRDSSPPAMEGFAPHSSARDTRFAGPAAKIAAALAQPLSVPCCDQPPSNDPREPVPVVRYFAVDGHELGEATTYRRPDGVLVRLFRDRGNSGRLYASLSVDGGATWRPALPTNIPDSPSRSSALSLPDGRTALIGNQVCGPPGRRRRTHYPRDPLVVGVSGDGVVFDWAAAIRAGAPRVRHKGEGKMPGFQHPSAVVTGQTMWVAYSVGKEDIAVTPVPLALLGGGA